MGVKEIIRPLKPQKKYLELFLADDRAAHDADGVRALQTHADEKRALKNISKASEVNRYYLKDCGRNSSRRSCFTKLNMGKTRKKSNEPKIQAYGRGRPRKKSFGRKCGNSNDKQSQDGSENGDGKNNRGRQQRGGGQGNGGNGGRRKKDDDDRDDENEDGDDDFDDNNEDDEEDEDEQTGGESNADDPETITPEQEAEMAQELLCLIPAKHLNCDPAEKPAKPGTAVDLHGVVLHETTGGLVVLNIRWRNKIYSGALIDVRKSKWATERIKPDPFPESVNPRPADVLNLGGKKKIKKSKSPEPSDKEPKKTTEQPVEQPFKEPSGVPASFKRPPDTTISETSDSGARKKARLSPPLIECPEPNCGKRYSHKNGLKYHQAHAHQKKDDQDDQKLQIPNLMQKPGTGDADSTANSSSTETHQINASSNMADPTERQIDVVGNSESPLKSNMTTLAFPATNPDVDNLKTSQIVPQVASNVPQSAAPNVSQMVPQAVIKTEEESAVDSIKDVNFEVSVKEEVTDSGDKDVPKIILEASTDEEPATHFAVGSSIGLTPFTSRSSLNFAQFSPTLVSLDPQMLNNSLSNALQTVTVKKEKESEAGEKEDAVGESEATNEDGGRSKLELNVQPNANFAISRDINEVIIPSSPDDFVSSDSLPDSIGLHLYQKNMKPGSLDRRSIQPPLTWNGEASTFSPSLFSVSLYNQLQEQASRQYPGADSVTGDLAEASDIQRAISQVDVRRHFSPMLLNYLNTGVRGKDNSTANVDNQNLDAVSTSDKPDEKGCKNENTDAAASIATSSQSSPRPESLKRERYADNRSNLGPLFAKQDFLQPNISAGRPILRPATKPDSITGGAKIAGGGQRICNQPAQAAAEARSEDTSQASLMFAAAAQDALSLQSAGKQNSLTPSATAFTDDTSNSADKAGTPKNPSQPGYIDKTMIEAKTWIPQEVYRQPAKSISGQDRGPSKEKQSPSVRIGMDFNKKTGSPYEYRPSMAVQSEEMKNAEKAMMKKSKPAPPAQQFPPGVPLPLQSAEGEKNKDSAINEKEVSIESSDASRFTLTNDRLAQSSAENRGRPRKIRVEKTQQIPIGSAKDVESSRGTPEQNQRKQQVTTCTYTRTSVIHSMATPPEDTRMGVSVKEEYVSPDGKRKASPRLPDRASFEKKMKQDFKKSEANRIFEAEREKLKNRHVESHYAMEVRNMHLRGNELPSSAKSELAIRGSVSPGISRMQSLAAAAQAEKAERHAREKMEAKSIPMSPAFGQSSPYHSSSDIDKIRSEYLQHDLSRLPFGLPSAEGYPGLPTSFPGGSYFGHRSGPSQADAIAHQRFEQLMSGHMDPEKAFSKYSAEKNELSLKLGPESSKMPPQDRMRGSGREGHSHRPPYYPQASPLGFQSREAGSATRSPKSSPFGFRPSEMFPSSRSQRPESEPQPKEAKPIDNRRDMRREYGMSSYSSPFFQPPFQYPMNSNAPGKGYAPRVSEQRSPYKHNPDADKPRYQGHPGNQPQTGPGGMLSANLVLTKADGLGFGSMPYDSRNPDGKK